MAINEDSVISDDAWKTDLIIITLSDPGIWCIDGYIWNFENVLWVLPQNGCQLSFPTRK